MTGSITKYGLEDRVLGKHELFFQYLQISPSYWLAHKKLGLKESLVKDELPADFKAVLALYKKVGDVFSITFNEWWEARGKGLFVAQASPDRVWLSVDLRKDREVLLADYMKLLDELDAKKNHKKSQINGIELITNKIRLTSLRQRVNLVTERAAYIDNKVKKETLWTIGKSAGIASKWTKHIRLDSKRTTKNMPVRNYLSILVSKNIKEALILAENAARGKFPSLAPAGSPLKFDYKNIKRISNEQIALFWNSLVRTEKAGGDWRRLFDPSKTTIRARGKGSKGKIDLGVSLESEYEAWIQSQAVDVQPEASNTEYESLVEAEAREIKARKRK